MYLDIDIRKPLYGNFVYIRDKFVKQAIREGKMLRITVPNGTGVISPHAWLKDGKRLEQEFKIPGVPMVLWGNHVPVDKEEDKTDDVKLRLKQVFDQKYRS